MRDEAVLEAPTQSVTLPPGEAFPPRDLPAPTVNLDWEKELRDWPRLEWPQEPIRPKPPTSRSILQVRLLAAVGVAGLAAFFIWLFNVEHRGDAWLFWPLVLALMYRGVCWLMEWHYYTRPKFEPFVPPRRTWTVDVLTTACPGEPRGMILRTLLAMKAIQYPHENYLCDEGDDPVLREACRQLGIHHVTRKEKKDAKAGNINNALRQSTGEITVVLDPDHEPAPYLLDRVLGYFEDPSVGFVQSVQAYRNQLRSLVANGSAKQTYLFYGPVMIGMHTYGTTQAIGANCVFRRAALDSIGGHAAGLAEDMHTTMRLYSKGWTSMYIPEIWTRGLVPETLSAYCKQQVKWSYGSFDLLFNHFAKLARGFTVWQKLHYFLGPLYFLRGLFGLIHIVIPILALTFGGIVWRVSLLEYLAMFTPALFVAAIIRHVTQRWAIEEHDRGFHFTGGVLGAGCWWIFLQGFLCAVFRVKLPYLPTPKDDTTEDCWRLATPNLIAAALSIAAVIYGLSRDWTPFSFMMATFAAWNAAQLTFVAMLGQQRTLQRLRQFFSGGALLKPLLPPFYRSVRKVHGTALRLMRERSVAIALPILTAVIAVHLWPRSPIPHQPGAGKLKNTGGFYTGIDLPNVAAEGLPREMDRWSQRMGTSMRLVPITEAWGPESLERFPEALMRQTRRKGAVPLITWTPGASAFPELRNDPELGRDRRIFAGILAGFFDDYLTQYAERIRDFGDPVLIRFAPQADHPLSPWGPAAGNNSDEFTQAWIYVVSAFSKLGASNVGWIWNPASPDTSTAYFPGTDYVDWIGISALNHGRMNGGQWREFVEIYRPFRDKLESHRLPVMLTEFGTVTQGGNRVGWLDDAFTAISRDFPEIRGVVLPNTSRGWFADPTADAIAAINRGLNHAALRNAPKKQPSRVGLWRDLERPAYRSKFITGQRGNFQLTVDQQPFYIHGVAYNPGHDWRDGNIPLTRRELTADFARLTAIGANTIRRYGDGWYDRNILQLAKEHQLKVLYGFWFEHHVDYLSDERKLKDYTATVEKTVRAWHDHPSVLGWSLGNEVWGLLKHHYAQPYLTEVRHAHIDFVQDLAQRIHAIDGRHPVFAAHEHSPHLAGTLSDYTRGAPALDFTAVNSYYEVRISELHSVTAQFDSHRPYLVGEFGPDGYWDAQYTRHDENGALLEQYSAEKARLYARGWRTHTEGHRGGNIGGLAYCWRDRFEATATWFGITDIFGRPKPAYYALQEAWTGKAAGVAPQITELSGPRGPLLPGATVQVNARVDSKNPNLRYQWELANDQFEFDLGRLRPIGNGASVAITLPKKSGDYRLYLNVTDGQSADTASLPLTVGQARAQAPRPDMTVSARITTQH